MSALWAKLNLKHQREIVVLNAPKSFAVELKVLRGVRIRQHMSAVNELTFALAFVARKAELDKVAATVMSKAVGDALLWFADPKVTAVQRPIVAPGALCDARYPTKAHLLHVSRVFGVVP